MFKVSTKHAGLHSSNLQQRLLTSINCIHKSCKYPSLKVKLTTLLCNQHMNARLFYVVLDKEAVRALLHTPFELLFFIEIWLKHFGVEESIALVVCLRGVIRVCFLKY